MAETKKLTKTKREVINEMLQDSNINSNEMYVNYLTHEIELLDKKASVTRTSKNQVANEGIKNSIVNALVEIARPVTITELQSENAEMATYSNQKLSALLTQLIKSERVVKTTDKKKSYFSVA